MKHRSWSELSTREQVGVSILGVVQVGLLVAALRDVRRRSAEEVRGRKDVWTAAAFINFIGPISYFLWGRR